MIVAAVANQPWPTELVEPFTRDPGGLALVPLAAWWILVLGWVATTDRLSRDAVARGMPAGTWGMILAFPFLAAALLAWWLPSLLVAIPVMLVAWWGPVFAYARTRNAKLPPEETILTISHARRFLGEAIGSLGISLPGSESASSVPLPLVSLAGDSAAPAEEQARRLKAASALPGFADAATIIAEAVNVGASAVLLDLVGEEVPVRQEIDGVWHPLKAWEWQREKRRRVERCMPAPPIPKAKAAGIHDALLVLVGVNPRAVRAKSSGRFSLKVDGKPWLGRLATQRSAAGETFVVRFEPQAIPFKSLGDLGIGEELAGRLTGMLALEKGLIAVTSPASSGRSTTLDRAVNAADRLLRNFISVEDAASPPREIQNVKPFRFDRRTGGTPLAALQQALREYPQVLVAADLQDQELAAELVSRAEAENLVVVGFGAADAIDGIGKLLALGADREKLAASLLGVVSQRLVRKLCPKCREKRPAPPELLVRLKKTPEEMPTVHVASKEGCRLCNGTGYRGRSGVFELAGGDTVRIGIRKKADRTVMQKAAVRDGMRPLSEAGMRLVAEGVTSLEELQRAFRSPGKK